MNQQEDVVGFAEDAAAFCTNLEELEMTTADLVRTTTGMATTDQPR
ncbi:hypothetical protein [Falsiroseomonas sp.]